jgi:predicted transcriptional regulator
MGKVLELSKDRPLKTQIMYRANLSFNQLNDYLEFLMNNNLLYKTSGAGKEVYVITEKGLDFLQRHNELTKMMENITK